MPSSPQLNADPSPPDLDSGHRRRSRFTYRHLSLLGSSSVHSPLRVIALVDLDAFYAQCEQIRLGLPTSQPLAVQQWQGLIAINYAARNFGLNRFIRLQEAQQKCPELICQHVPTWKEGEDFWAYRDDSAINAGLQKASLDPYRRESRKIIHIMKDCLPEGTKVEKASIDEMFIDLSTVVHKQLLDKYEELHGPPPYDDPTEALPAPGTTIVDFASADALIDLNEGETEEDDPDWDDVAMQIGSEVVREIRATIKLKLNYTCSAGIANNKMMAKLGSGYQKPNKQTVVRNRAVQTFLSTFKFTDMRGLGGKFGAQIRDAFGTETVDELLKVPMETMRAKLGDEAGKEIYKKIRGHDHEEVSTRTQIKSMLSAKSFRPSINDFETGVKWMKIFATDIYARLVEDGLLEKKRRPRTLDLSHRRMGTTTSKQVPIPTGKTITADVIFDLGVHLMKTIGSEGNLWPCANLSLSVRGFEDGPSTTKGIDMFLLRGQEAKDLNAHKRQREGLEEASEQKRPRTGADGLRALLLRNESSVGTIDDDDFGRDRPSSESGPPDEEFSAGPEAFNDTTATLPHDQYACDRCGKRVPLADSAEHADWHFAKDLERDTRAQDARDAQQQGQQQGRAGNNQISNAAGKPGHRIQQQSQKGPAKDRPPAAGGAKGQRRLMFGSK